MQRFKESAKSVATGQFGRNLVVSVAVAMVAAGLSGCNGGGLSPTAWTSSNTAKSAISGSVYGGQQPVVGATMQLYTVGTTGLQSGSTPLITPGSVLTDVNGNFSISGTYSCTGATQVYLTATGGSSGAGSNSAIALMAPLGTCANLLANAATTFVSLNEVTTVGSAYALAGFMSSYTNIGASGANPTGLVNAVTNFNTLVNLASGGSVGSSIPFGATVPSAEINTLANILAACINSAGSTSSACNSLLGATGASDTIGAALAIAKNPGSTTYTALFNLAASTPPFQPALSSTPADWTIAINYTGSGTLKSPSGIAIDAAGNAWVSNSASGGLVKLTSNGNLYNNFTGGGLLGAKAVAVDRLGNIWLANAATNALIEFNSAGVVQSGTGGYTGGGLNGPVSLAIDSANNIWVANQNGNSVSEFTNGGTPVNGAGFTGSGSINLPSGIALDASGNVWIANYGNSNVVELTNAGAVATGSPFSDSALQGPSSIAIDSGNNVWVPGATTGVAVAGAVSQFNSVGVSSSASPFLAGGLKSAAGVATSGTDAWVVNKKSASGLTQLRLGQSAPLSPTAGLGSLSSAAAVAVDASGDVWTANSGDNSVSQFIGLTTPVVTPIAVNVGP